MQQKTITFWSHLRNLKNTLISIPIGLVISIFLYLIDRDEIVFIVFGIGYGLAFIPVILIHLNYIKTDKDKVIAIDRQSELIEIIDKQSKSKIYLNEIQKIIWTTGLERSGSSIWSGYYYYQIDLKNGQIIFITSLLLKTKEFPFDVNLKRRTAFPFAKYYDSEKDKLTTEIKKDEEANNEIDSFYIKYSNYSIEKLNEIIENRKLYENSAVKAAEKLLNEQNYGCQHHI